MRSATNIDRANGQLQCRHTAPKAFTDSYHQTGFYPGTSRGTSPKLWKSSPKIFGQGRCQMSDLLNA